MAEGKGPGDGAGEGGGEIGYADAIAELDEILAALEDDDLDIDVLGDRVARAATLISLCRDRIDAARLRVTEVVANLEPGEM